MRFDDLPGAGLRPSPVLFLEARLARLTIFHSLEKKDSVASQMPISDSRNTRVQASVRIFFLLSDLLDLSNGRFC